MDDNATTTRAVGFGGLGFGAQWASRFLHGVRDIIVGPDDSQRDTQRLAGAIAPRRGPGPGRPRHTDDLHV